MRIPKAEQRQLIENAFRYIKDVDQIDATPASLLTSVRLYDFVRGLDMDGMVLVFPASKSGKPPLTLIIGEDSIRRFKNDTKGLAQLILEEIATCISDEQLPNSPDGFVD